MYFCLFVIMVLSVLVTTTDGGYIWGPGGVEMEEGAFTQKNRTEEIVEKRGGGRRRQRSKQRNRQNFAPRAAFFFNVDDKEFTG